LVALSGMHRFRQREDLIGEVEQLAVLEVLLLDRLPLVVGDCL
jgi:hypothetical protein